MLAGKSVRAAAWLGGELPYPPLSAWRPLSQNELRTAWAARGRGGLGLYVHLPPMLALRTDSPFDPPLPDRAAKIGAYLRCLRREADLLGLPSRPPVRTLYVGGGGLGVLSTFPPEQVEALLRLIAERFDLRACRQRTVELRPTPLPQETARLLARLGVDRITMLLPDPATLANRRAGAFEDVARNVRLCRRAGIAGVDVDLAFDGGARSRALFPRSLDAVLDMRPDSVHIMPSLGDVSSPDRGARARREFLDAARERIRAALKAPEQAGPHGENLQLADARIFGASVLGLGYGASSHVFAGVKYAKSGTYLDYWNRLERGRLPPILGIRMDEDSEMRAYLSGQFEDVGWLDLQVFGKVFPEGLPARFARALDALVASGLCEREGSVVRMAPSRRARRFEVARLFHAPAYRRKGSTASTGGPSLI